MLYVNRFFGGQMKRVPVNQLTAEHFARWPAAYIEDTSGRRQKVWERIFMAPEMSRITAELALSYGTIEVASVDHDTVVKVHVQILGLLPAETGIWRLVIGEVT